MRPQPGRRQKQDTLRTGKPVQGEGQGRGVLSQVPSIIQGTDKHTYGGREAEVPPKG